MCGMMGKLENQEECICGGTGKEFVYDQKPLFAISASLAVFSFIARYGYQLSEFVTNARNPQIFLFIPSADYGINGSYISGEFSMALINWFIISVLTSRKRLETVIGKVRDATITAHRKMCGKLFGSEVDDFRAVLYEDTGFHISVPGNACGIDPGYRYFENGEGYEFCGHNIDSPIQQISILAGLAVLHDIARLHQA
jgi:hypothetical protein